MLAGESTHAVEALGSQRAIVLEPITIERLFA